MDTNNGQAQAAPTSDQPTASAAPANAENGTAEAISSSQPQAETQADADAQLRAFYDGEPSAGGADAGKTEEQVRATDSKEGQTATEQPKVEDKAPEVKTPAEDDPKTTDAPEQMRPRLHDPQDIAVAALAKAKGITLVKAAAIIAAADAPSATIPGTEPAAQASASQALEAEIAALDAEIKAEREGDSFLTAEHQDKRDRLTELRADLRIARFQERQTDDARRQATETTEAVARSKSEAAAVAAFPDVANGDTPLGANTAKIIAEWHADPGKRALLAEGDAPMLVTREGVHRTALELVRGGKYPTYDLAVASLAPAPALTAKTPAPQSSQQPAPQQPPATRRVTPAPGFKGQVVGDQPSSLARATAQATTAKECNDLLESFYGREPLSL